MNLLFNTDETVIIENSCLLCGKESCIKLKKEMAIPVMKYLNGMTELHELPLNPPIREFIKTGMCKSCQKKMFGVTAPEIKEKERK